MASSTLDQLALEEEEEELEVPGEEDHHEQNLDPQLCLVRRFLTNRSLRIHMMKQRMAGVWRPGRGITIKEVDGDRFLFQFYHKVDIQRVLKGGPWSFDGHLLILGMMQHGEIPQQVELYKVPFWVQVHNIPVGFMTVAVGQLLANFMGDFLEYDEKNFLRSYMRVRVLIDVRKPLKRLKRVKKPGGVAKEVMFKYEKLGSFCYLCGMLGHVEDYCERLFTLEEDDGHRLWGPDLRVEQRRNTGGDG